MKFQQDFLSSAGIRRYDRTSVLVGNERISHSVILSTESPPRVWPCQHFDELGPELFALLANPRPEVVLFGSGDMLRFPKPQWLRPLIEAGVGVETMDNGAACRTYNILAGEGRKVTMALLLAAADQPGETSTHQGDDVAAMP